jgi:hypothetical protein
MSTKKQPLTPPDCDLRDFGDMPIEVGRLRDSSLVSDETPEVCWAAFLLWAASWHQVPAASIPANDRWQAKAAGYVSRGQIDPHWDEIRAAVLRKWVPCSDGRLYHPVMAEKANEAWSKRLHYFFERAKERLRFYNRSNKEKHSDAKEIKPITFEQWNQRRSSDGTPLESTEAWPETPPEKRTVRPPAPSEVADVALGIAPLNGGATSGEWATPQDSGVAPAHKGREGEGKGIGREHTPREADACVVENPWDEGQTRSPPPVPPPVPEPTRAGAVCKALKAAGIADVNPGHATLLALIEAGCSDAEFFGAAKTAVDRGKGFAYAMGTLTRQRAEAAQLALHRGPLPNRQEALEQANLAVAMRWAASTTEGGSS